MNRLAFDGTDNCEDSTFILSDSVIEKMKLNQQLNIVDIKFSDSSKRKLAKLIKDNRKRKSDLSNKHSQSRPKETVVLESSHKRSSSVERGFEYLKATFISPMKQKKKCAEPRSPDNHNNDYKENFIKKTTLNFTTHSDIELQSKPAVQRLGHFSKKGFRKGETKFEHVDTNFKSSPYSPMKKIKIFSEPRSASNPNNNYKENFIKKTTLNFTTHSDIELQSKPAVQRLGHLSKRRSRSKETSFESFDTNVKSSRYSPMKKEKESSSSHNKNSYETLIQKSTLDFTTKSDKEQISPLPKRKRSKERIIEKLNTFTTKIRTSLPSPIKPKNKCTQQIHTTKLNSSRLSTKDKRKSEELSSNITNFFIFAKPTNKEVSTKTQKVPPIKFPV